MKPLTERTKRLLGGAFLAVLVIGAAVFMIRGLLLAARADDCARELAGAAERKDAAYVDRAVRNQSARDQILSAAKIELGFVRPISSEWTRVGLFLWAKPTSTSAAALVLVFSSESKERCEFLRDYENGPFGAGDPNSKWETHTTTAPSPGRSAPVSAPSAADP
jgi:hypothetical protein